MICRFTEQLRSKFGVNVPVETVATMSVPELARWLQTSDVARASHDVDLADKDLQELSDWIMSRSVSEQLPTAPSDSGAIILTGQHVWSAVC
jgi:hypothetical protein